MTDRAEDVSRDQRERRALSRLRRVTLVTGKGGVGKTTIAAALAAELAARDGGAVFVEFGDGEAGKRALEGVRGVLHRVIDPRDAMEQAVSGMFGSKLLGKVFLGNFAVKPMLRAAPALRELAMLECVRLIADEAKGKRLVVDLPATGHGIAWMRLPTLMRDLFGEGPLYELSERVTKQLISPESSAVVIVSLPERLVLLETLELQRKLAGDLRIDVAAIVINRIPPEPPTGSVETAMRTPGDAAVALHRLLAARQNARKEGLETLREASGMTTPHVLVSEFAHDPTVSEIGALLTTEGLV